MQKKSNSHSAFLTRRTLVALLLCIAACSVATGTLLAVFRSEAPANRSRRTLTFAERVAYQRAIEDVYWRHRIWPKENLNPKPPLDAVMSQGQLEKKVTDYLRKSQVLEDYWQRPITAEQLQAEMDRMAKHSRQPEVLRELFEALGNDPFLIAECLARPVLSERLITSFAQEQRKGRLALSEVRANSHTRKLILANTTYTLPTISDPATGCTPDTWTDTSTTGAPAARTGHTAVWTGSEMIIWGGRNSGVFLSTGGRYNPSTDDWTDTSITNAPAARFSHTAVWTGSEMIVWGGLGNIGVVNTGGRYNPGTDSWIATSTTNAPAARTRHTAVWTGSEMIVWGGSDNFGTYFNSGGRYNPSTNSWAVTSTVNAPQARDLHTTVWTGSEMIVWGGEPAGGQPPLNTGGRYNPSIDSWTPTSTSNVPDPREYHTAVWTGNEMIVWGGGNVSSFYLGTGGKYVPATNSWTATSTTDAPAGREFHTAVWTGSEMTVWGGTGEGRTFFNSGGRYNSSMDSWTATSTINAPLPRERHTAVWTGGEMIVWGGLGNTGETNTGGRYCAQPGPPPSPTPTATATPTPTSTPTATATPRVTPTRRPRPSPAPRP